MEESSENLFSRTKPPDISIKQEVIEQEKKIYLKTPEEKRLETEEIIGKKELKGGVNKVYIIEFNGGLGIFKPKSGEAFTATETLPGSQRERAAYLVNKFLGFDLIPATVIREIDGEVGSLQEFIPDTKAYDGELDKFSLIDLGLLDYINFNRDRHPANLLTEKTNNKKIYAIDNGLTFTKIKMLGGGFIKDYPDVVKIRDIIFCDTPIPENTRERIEEFLSNKEEKELLRGSLSELLGHNNTEACFKRIEKVGQFAKKGKIETNDLLEKMTFE